MKYRIALVLIAFLSVALATVERAYTSADNNNAHLTIYDVGIAEFLEERTVELQTGLNTMQWRNLMPKAFLQTVRVVAEGAEVVRQDVTYDGVEVRNEKAPVLHLVINNKGAATSKRVRVDYLAPDIDWQNDYSLVLEPTAQDAPPTAAGLDAWVSIFNRTGTDLKAGTVDLVAGELSLLLGEGRFNRDALVAQNIAPRNFADESNAGESSAESTTLSAFNRFRLGNNITLNANAPVSRFPLFQRARIGVEQRLVFENQYNTQTLARGGFNLLPRGLEVRLVSRNTVGVPMPAGQVTIYSGTNELVQIVGQDRIGYTATNGEFTVSQGRSSTVLGTRRILERRTEDYQDQKNRSREKLLTKVELVIINRGTRPIEAYIREGIEPYGENQWSILESPVPAERLGANIVQFKVNVAAAGKTVVVYRVETK
ncbi:MAG: hypothetical protein AB1489_11130 [Acidobacteriota bacterium]